MINKTHHGLTSPLSVTGLAASATAQVYQYGQAHPKAIMRKPAQAFHHGAATVTFPGYSITEFVVPASGRAAGPRRATGTVAASSAVPATGAGPADGFLWAAGYRGARVAGGWSPSTVRRCHGEPSLTGAGC